MFFERKDANLVPFKNPHPLYSVWHTPTARQWSDYGGRGIKICAEWDSFDQFIADMGARPSDKHSLDRIDNDSGYSPENCRWALKKKQQRNQRRTRHITIEGRVYVAADLAEISGHKTDTIVERAKIGLPFEEIITPRRHASGDVRKAIATRVANQLARTHCKNGHPWTPENTGQQKGGRYCRACHALKTARQRAAKRHKQRTPPD